MTFLTDKDTNSSSLYHMCAVEYTGSSDAILQCIADAMESDWINWLLVISGALVLFMQTGFAMLCAGCVRKKNLQNTMLKNLLDTADAAITFFCTGFAFAYGGDSDDNTDGMSLGHSVLGTMVLWFGWYGLNPGSALLHESNVQTGEVAARAAVNTTLAAGTGAVGALLMDLHLKHRQTGEWRLSLTVGMNGLLTALVAITAGCATVESYGAILIGLVAGWLYMTGSALMLRRHIDDSVDAIPVHMMGGALGTVATGLFATPDLLKATYGTDQFAGLFYASQLNDDKFVLLGNQCIAVLFILAWITCTMLPFFVLLIRYGFLRAEALDELIGLDVVLHGGHYQEQGHISDEQQRRGSANEVLSPPESSPRRHRMIFNRMGRREYFIIRGQGGGVKCNKRIVGIKFL